MLLNLPKVQNTMPTKINLFFKVIIWNHKEQNRITSVERFPKEKKNHVPLIWKIPRNKAENKRFWRKVSFFLFLTALTPSWCSRWPFDKNNKVIYQRFLERPIRQVETFFGPELFYFEVNLLIFLFNTKVSWELSTWVTWWVPSRT